jgi:tetratricopeptide (TPR) repeat protein
MNLRRALLLVPFLAAPAFGESIEWKTKWPEALAEAKKSGKCALLLFFNNGVKRSKSFDTETLVHEKVVAAMRQYVCARIDPEGPDEDNFLWQKHQSPTLPMTYIYDPTGTQLASVRTTDPEPYARQLETIAPVYAHQVAPAREALAKDPEQPEALSKLAGAYLLLDNPVESAKCYAKSVEVLVKKGDKAKALAMLTEQLDKYYEAKWYVPARDCCRKLAELDSSNETKLVPKALWVQGMADCTDGKWNDAIAVLKPACDKYKDSDLRAKMMFSLASAYMYGGNKPTAADVFDAIVKEYPDSDTAKIAATQLSKIRK